MKRLLLLIAFVCLCSAAGAKQAPLPQPDNAKIEQLQHTVDSLHKTIVSLEAIRQESKDNCTEYYDRLDNEMDRTINKLAIMMGIISVFLGAVLPLAINYFSKRDIENRLKDQEVFFRDNIASNLRSNRDLRDNLRHQIEREIDKFEEHNGKAIANMDAKLKDIQDIKEDIEKLKQQIEVVLQTTQESAKEAEESAKRATISKLFSEAFNEPNLEKQIEKYSEILEMDDSNAIAFYNRGYAYSKLKQYSAATSDYTKAIELNPRYAEAYNNRGISYSKLGLYKMAFKDYNKAIEINPNNDAAYNNRAMLPIRMNSEELYSYNEALADVNKAIALDPNDICQYDTRGCLNMALVKYQEALNDFNTAIEKNDRTPDVYENRAKVFKLLAKQTKSKEEKAKYLESAEKDEQKAKELA